MPVTLVTVEDTAGVSLAIDDGSPGVTVLSQESPCVIITSATAPGPPGADGVDGTDGTDANWAVYTQEEYDALPSPDPSTLYVIVPS